MHKDALIILHQVLVKLARSHPSTADAPMPEYEAWGVKPGHVGKSVAHHQRAVFLLAKGLADVVEDDRHTASLYFAQKAKAYQIATPNEHAHDEVAP